MVVNVGNTGNAGRAAGNAWGVAERYREFSWWEARGRSDAHEELSARISQDPEFCDLLSGSLPAGSKQQPDLLLAAVRYLDGPHAEMGPRGAAAYGRWREWTIRHWDEVRTVIMQRAAQTNEPAHCAPCCRCSPSAAAAGAAGGRHVRGAVSAPRPLPLPVRGRRRGRRGPPGGRRPPGRAGAPESPLVLTCRTGGAADELPERLPQIVWRAGIDLDPLDPVDERDDLRWLQALVWPGDEERAARLSAAVDAVRTAPRPRMVRGDLIDELPALAAEAPPEATLVIFHSAVLPYLPPARREEFVRLVRSLLDRRPGGGHWISTSTTPCCRGSPTPHPTRPARTTPCI